MQSFAQIDLIQTIYTNINGYLFTHAILTFMDTLEFITRLTRDTGILLLKYYQHSGINTQIKSDNTVVTEADLAADAYIQEQLMRTFPGETILSEEANTTFPTDKSAVWVIDPLDGTTNFSLGFHYWGISIARIVNGYPDLGVLYFPMIDEQFTATKGGGAFLNGVRLQVKPPGSSQRITFFSCCSRTHRVFNVKLKYKTRILGSAAYGLSTVARGSALLALEVTPKIWDFSASWLITEEAGGLIAPLIGENPYPLIAGLNYESNSYPLLSAATPDLFDEGRSKLEIRSKD